MTEPEAMAVKNEIIALCRKHGLFWYPREVHEPHLKSIKMEISIKVEGDKG